MKTNDVGAALQHTHCTYIVEEGGESIAIDLEVAVIRALQQMCHMFKPTTSGGEREREKEGGGGAQLELFSLSQIGDK